MDAEYFPVQPPVFSIPPVQRVIWRSRITVLLMVVLGTLAISYRIARIQVGRSYEDMDSGNALLEKGEYAESITMFERALDRNESLTLAWTGKGLSLLYLGRYNEALTQYEQALAIEPAFSVAWYGRGISLMKLGRYRDALSCFDRILELYPKDTHAAQLRREVLELMRHRPGRGLIA